MMTQHGAPAALSASRDSQRLVDIDLAILGSPPERFVHCKRAFRKEYGWVSGSRYRTARAQVSESYADRLQLYRTAAAVALLEGQACINVAAAPTFTRRRPEQ